MLLGSPQKIGLSGPLLDTLVHLTPEAEAAVRAEASRRQMETLHILLDAEGRRLNAMNEQAKAAMDEWSLVQRLHDHADTVDPTVYDSLVAVEKAILHYPNSAPCSQYIDQYPLHLLSENEAEDVKVFQERLLHLKEQTELLEMLQSHEAKSFEQSSEIVQRSAEKQAGGRRPSQLASSPHRSMMVPASPTRHIAFDHSCATEDDEEAGTGTVENNGEDGMAERRDSQMMERSNNNHNNNSTACNASFDIVLVAQPPLVVDAQCVEKPHTMEAETQSPPRNPETYRRPPVWLKHLPNLPEEELDDTASYDNRMNLYVEQLQREVHALRRESEAWQETAAQRTRDVHRLTEDNERLTELHQQAEQRVQEYYVLMTESSSSTTAVSARLHGERLSFLYREEQLRRSVLHQQEEAARVRIDQMLLQSLLAFSSIQRDEEEAANCASQRRAEESDALAATAMEDKLILEESLETLREDMASLGAERTLLQAKLDLSNETIRLDAERHRRQVAARDAEIASLKHRLEELERLLDKKSSVRISSSEAARAVEAQGEWDAKTAVRPLSSAQPPTRHTATEAPPRLRQPSPRARLSTDDAPPPAPRTTKPPVPTARNGM